MTQTPWMLVTGGAGFIGSHLAAGLLDAGYRVVVVDNLVTGKRENIPAKAEFLKADLLRPETYAALESQPFAGVLHLASQSCGEASFDDPEADLRSHVLATFRLLEWCRDRGISRVLYASSSTIYGDPREVPVTENAPLCPKTYYAAGKAAAESYLRLFNNRGGRVTIFRLPNVYGPGQDLANIRQGMVSIFLAYLLAGKPIEVRGSLERYRDFLYVGDLARAWLKAVDAPATFGQTYNLGSGTKTTVGQLLDGLTRAFGHETYPYALREGTPGDQTGVVLDIDKVCADLGWRPETTLEQGLAVLAAHENGTPPAPAANETAQASLPHSRKDRLHHDVAGADILASDDARFATYRKKWAENPQNLTPGDMPLHLDIEVTSLCNLRCPFCAITSKTAPCRSIWPSGFSTRPASSASTPASSISAANRSCIRSCRASSPMPRKSGSSTFSSTPTPPCSTRKRPGSSLIPAWTA